MKKSTPLKLFLVLALLLTMIERLYPQTLMNDMFIGRANLTFLGLDLTQAKFIDHVAFPDTDALKYIIIPGWNKLMIDEPEKFGLAKALQLLPDKYSTSVDHHIELNKKMQVRNQVVEISNGLSEDQIVQAVMQYNLEDKKGVGLSFIVESFDKPAVKATVWLTFFDMSTKKILLAEKVNAQPAGVGIRNYWAGAIYDINKKIKKDLNEKWRKESENHFVEAFWNSKYQEFEIKGKANIQVNKTNSETVSENRNNTKNISDSALIELIMSGPTDSNAVLERYRFDAFIIYKKDTTRTKPLWALSQVSEYLADYQLAANCYRILIGKLDKATQKAEISKARAHQITCGFLAQSQEKKTLDSTKSISGKNGFYSVVIDYEIANGHVYITDVPAGKQAEKSGILPCDEITKINGVALADDWISPNSVDEKLKGEKGTTVTLTIKRLGGNKPQNIIVTREFFPIAENIAVQNVNAPKDTTMTNVVLTTKQDKKQTFLKKMVTAIQNDTTIMNNIETVHKVTYALAVINKWANEPIGNKYFLQINEQLGMVASLINVIKGSNANFNFESNGKVAFNNPELKELVETDNAKEEQTKFDAAAHTQPVKGIKIDENISFVELNLSNLSGEYDWEYISSSLKTGDFPHAREKKTLPYGGLMEALPFTIIINESNISTSTGHIYTSPKVKFRYVCESSGTIKNNVAILTGTCKNKECSGLSCDGNDKFTTKSTIDFTKPDSIIVTTVYHCLVCTDGKPDSKNAFRIIKMK